MLWRALRKTNSVKITVLGDAGDANLSPLKGTLKAKIKSSLIAIPETS